MNKMYGKRAIEFGGKKERVRIVGVGHHHRRA